MPGQRTEFRILYDDEALYVSVWCFESSPDRIVAREMAQDGRIVAGDHVIVVLDTFLDHRNGYEFLVNPNGARGKALIRENVDLRA